MGNSFVPDFLRKKNVMHSKPMTQPIWGPKIKDHVVTEDESGHAPAVDEIGLMTSMVCSFVLDNGKKKTVPFTMIYMGLTVTFLGLSLKDGYLICDTDAKLAEAFEIPEVESINGYQSMRLSMMFSNGKMVDLDLTPTQMFIIIGKFEFDVSDPNGEFTCLPDEKLIKMYFLNSEEVAKYKEEGEASAEAAEE